MTSTVDVTAADVTSKSEAELKKLSRQFNRTVWRARGAIFWERLWPKLVPAACVGGTFCAASWAGLWVALPPQGRMIGLLAFAGAAAMSLAVPFIRGTGGSLKVTEKEALRRIDRNNGDPARPAQTLKDSIEAPEAAQNMAEDLRGIHLSKIWNKWAGKFKAGTPQSAMAKHDPYALRFVVALAMVVTAAMAGDKRDDHIMTAFDWTTPAPPPVDIYAKGWVLPPQNIDKDDIYIKEEKLAQPQAEKNQGDGQKQDMPPLAEAREFTVHERSVLTLVVIGKDVNVTVNGKPLAVKDTIKPRLGAENNGVSYQYEPVVIEKDTLIAIENGPRWNFVVTPDAAPTTKIDALETVKDKNNELPPTLHLTCTADDDNGVIEGEVVMTPADETKPGTNVLPSAGLPRIVLPRGEICP